MMPDDLHELFTHEDEEPMIIDMPTILQRSNDFQGKVRNRNFLEVFAAGVVVALFGRSGLTADTWLAAIGPLSISLGGLFIAWKLAMRGDAPIVEPASTTTEWVAQHRASLLYQADLLGSVPRWYLGPIVPGLVWIYALRLHEEWGTDAFALGAMLFVASMAFVAFVAWLNLKAAAKLRAEAEALPTLDT